MLNQKIRKLRRSKNLTQTQLSGMLGVAQSTIVSWENGQRKPDIDSLMKMAEIFGVSTDELLGRVPMNYRIEDLTQNVTRPNVRTSSQEPAEPDEETMLKASAELMKLIRYAVRQVLAEQEREGK